MSDDSATAIAADSAAQLIDLKGSSNPRLLKKQITCIGNNSESTRLHLNRTNSLSPDDASDSKQTKNSSKRTL